MNVHSFTLPDDPAELKALLLEQLRINVEQQCPIDQQGSSTPALESEKLKEAVRRQKTCIEILEDQLCLMREHQFRKRSENLNNVDQLLLFNEAEIVVDDS